MIVTIDGPAGAGKSTVGLRLAARLGAIFVDTGLFYRGLTALARANGVSWQDGDGLAGLVPDLDRTLSAPSSYQQNGPASDDVRVWPSPGFVPGIDSLQVEAHVSAVASHQEVRAALLPVQRRAAQAERVVAAGRDVGSVVFPEAEIKVYLDASLGERAQRRAAQAGDVAQAARVGAALAHRDETDSGRAVAPLTIPPGAIVVSTDGLSIEEVVNQLELIVSEVLRSGHD